MAKIGVNKSRDFAWYKLDELNYENGYSDYNYPAQSDQLFGNYIEEEYKQNTYDENNLDQDETPYYEKSKGDFSPYEEEKSRQQDNYISIDRLEDLKELAEKGLITHEEYDLLRRKALYLLDD